MALKTLSDDEAAELLVVVTDTRHELRNHAIDVLKPMETWTFNEWGRKYMIGAYRKLSRHRGHPLQIAYSVWMYTFRASTVPEMTMLGRAMWAELGRGLPGIEAARDRMIAKGADKSIRISDASTFPML